MDIALDLFNTAFKHEINVIRNRENFVRGAVKIINDIELSYENRLKVAVANLSLKDIDRLQSGKYTGSEALKRLSRLISEMVSAIEKALRAYTTTNLIDIAQYEVMFWRDRFAKLFEGDELKPLRQSVKRPDGRTVRGIPLSIAAGGVALIPGLRSYRRARVDRLRGHISRAAADGHVGLVRLFGVSKRARNTGRVIGESVAGMAQRLRALHLGTVSTASKQFIDENPVLDLVWTAQTEPGKPGIDNRTTAICISRNGKLVNRDLEGQVPPGHAFGCRSAVYPTVDYKSLTRSQKKRLSKETSMALKRGLPTANSSTEAFNRLSDSDKREMLGPVRYQLWREGGVKFPSGFINTRDERKYTIDEIARREGIDISRLRRAG